MSVNEPNMEEVEENGDDEELLALREMKNQLMAEVCELREKLAQEERKRELEATANFIGFESENNDIQKKRVSRKEIELTEQILGASFQDVSKVLLEDGNYQYKATLTTKALSIAIELTVNEKNNEIQKLDSYFPDSRLDACYRKEMEPWINMFKNMKDMSSLTSALLRYVDLSYFRNKILRRLEKLNYITKENSTNEEGGLTVHVHPPEKRDNIYLTIQWATKYLKRTLQVEHHFIIESTTEESSFMKRNTEIVKRFRKSTLSTHDIDTIWTDLIHAIDNEK